MRHDGTKWGETVWLVGDLAELGGWDPAKGLELSADAWPLWRGKVTLPAGVRAEYKLVVRKSNGTMKWQSGPNRMLRVPPGGAEATMEIQY